MSAKENARLDMAADVIVAGVESGGHALSYWSKVTGYGWATEDKSTMGDPIAEGRSSDAWASVRENDGGRVFVFTAENVLAAMRDIAADASWAGYGWDGELRNRIAAALNDPEQADFDANDADCIMQRAMLGGLIYG